MKMGHRNGVIFHRFRLDENELIRRIDGNSTTTNAVARRKPTTTKTMEVRVSAGVVRSRSA